jgi:hypothetical protein
MNMATLNQITKYNQATDDIVAARAALTATITERRNKKVARMIKRFIKRLGGQNVVLQKGITAANTTIVENRALIASATAIDGRIG